MNEYLNIKEFSKLVGLSRQAIYQRLGKDLKPFVKVDNGRKSIASKALSFFESRYIDMNYSIPEGYMSIKDYAKLKNVSKQAIYQSTDKGLNQFTKIENGRKLISCEALEVDDERYKYKRNYEVIGRKQRFDVLNRDLFTCQYCGKRPPEAILEVDHIKPVSKGGDNSISNLITACKDCNVGKYDRELPDAALITLEQQKNIVSDFTATITLILDSLKNQLETKDRQISEKDKQISEKDKQISELTTALLNEQRSAQQAQALHAGTITQNTIEETTGKKGLISKWFRQGH